MIYLHQKKAIEYITDKFKADPEVYALIISGSIAHGFNHKYSDIDINIIVSNSSYEQKKNNNTITYWESAEQFYKLDNKIFFPYHKWLIKVLENAPLKPPEFMDTIFKLMDKKSGKNIDTLYQIIKNYKDWTHGINYSWSSYFVHDIETVWMRGKEFIENI